MLYVTMRSVIMLSVIMLNVVMPSVVAPTLTVPVKMIRAALLMGDDVLSTGAPTLTQINTCPKATLPFLSKELVFFNVCTAC